MNRFQKIVWSINGVALLLLFLIVGFLMIRDLVRTYGPKETPRVIVGEELQEAKDKGLVLQGIEHDTPIRIYGSNEYFLPVRIKTYNVPKRSPSAFDADARSRMMVEVNYSNTVNIAFLDKNLQATHSLLDRKAFISSFRYPSENQVGRYNSSELDSSIRCMSYLIAFEDSDQNGTINEDDSTNLYISTLDGKDLFQVTSGIDINDYEFISPDKMLISYFKRDGEPKEHKRKYLALFKMKEKKLEQLTSLDKELNKIEELLTK